LDLRDSRKLNPKLVIVLAELLSDFLEVVRLRVRRSVPRTAALRRHAYCSFADSTSDFAEINSE
jgi:hypothetical protein